MSAGIRLEEIHKAIAQSGAVICVMIVKRSVSRILLMQVKDTLKIAVTQIDEVLNE